MALSCEDCHHADVVAPTWPCDESCEGDANRGARSKGDTTRTNYIHGRNPVRAAVQRVHKEKGL